MNKQRMTFDIDRHTVTEGDVVEVKWQCAEAEAVMLTLDNGFRSTDIPLENTGTKRFRLNRSKGRTRLTITVTINGKKHQKSLRVRVKKTPTVRAETIDDRGRRQGALKQWWQKRLTNWHNHRQRLKLNLQALPERKQMAVKLLTLIAVVLLLSAIWPKIYNIGLALLAAYLLVVMFRR